MRLITGTPAHQMLNRLLPDKSGEVRRARIPPRFAGFFVSVVVQGYPPEARDNWYTNWYTLR